VPPDEALDVTACGSIDSPLAYSRPAGCAVEQLGHGQPPRAGQPRASMPTTVFRASDAARDALDRTLALLRRHLTNEGDQP
jgi:hypothetical protein